MANFFSASFYVFEMLIFGKLMKTQFQRFIGLPAFYLLFLLCVQSSKSCRKGSVLTEPPPPPPKQMLVSLTHTFNVVEEILLSSSFDSEADNLTTGRT